MERIEVDVVLTTYKKPESLRKQLDAVKAQTLKPANIYLYQDGIDSYYRIVLEKEILQEFSDVRIADSNGGVWKRFQYAWEIVKSPYVCIFDDDAVPGKRWLENCYGQMRQREGIYGTNGILLTGDDNYPLIGSSKDRRIGWMNPNQETAMVDFVGHAWFLKTEWLAYMFEGTSEISDQYKYVGEDMCLSCQCSLHGINTYVPPHPFEHPEMWGALPKSSKRFGVTEVAVSASSSNHQLMNDVLKKMRKRGWEIVFERDRVYYEHLEAVCEKEQADKGRRVLQTIHRLWDEGKDIYLYGAGAYGELFYQYLRQNRLKIKAFIVSNPVKDKKLFDIPIISVDDFLRSCDECVIIFSLNEFYHDEIRKKLEGYQQIKLYPAETDVVLYSELVEIMRGALSQTTSKQI